MTTAKQTIALCTRLREGRELACEEAHATIPSAVAADLRARGVKGWRIRRHGRDLFHLIETDDHESFVGTPPTNQEAADRQARMDPYPEITNTPGSPETNAPHLMWSLSANGDRARPGGSRRDPSSP
jgi:L-rhamnose mutarotase